MQPACPIEIQALTRFGNVGQTVPNDMKEACIASICSGGAPSTASILEGRAASGQVGADPDIALHN